MQLTNLLLPLLFAISGSSADRNATTLIKTFYTTLTVSRVVRTTTCTSTTTAAAVATSSAYSPVTTEVITKTVIRIPASSPKATLVASASARMPYAHSNATSSVAISSPTVVVLYTYTGAASGLTAQFGAAAIIAAVAGVAQML